MTGRNAKLTDGQVVHMMAGRTHMIEELDKLIHRQVHIFKQDAKISDLEMSEYHTRYQRIRAICTSLNQGGLQTWSENEST